MKSIDQTPSITFVIGAGASKEANMPTGHELKGVIAKSLAFEVDEFNRLKGGNDRLREALSLLVKQQTSNGDANDYFQTSRLIRSAMSLAPSIDNFIDSHRKNTRVAELGKLAIASAILYAERQSLLYVDPSNRSNRLKFDAVADKWFTSFFQLLTLNTQAEDLPTRFRKVCIVSFNYDRTLEHFLHYSLQNYYALSPEQATEMLRDLRVFHPYGTVGALPWQSTGTAVPFGTELPTPELIKVSGALRTFTEGTDTFTSRINEIRSSVLDAKQLVFLGFAYHELNLQVLFGPYRDSPRRVNSQVYGSAFGLSESNKKAIALELATLGRYDWSGITLRRELTAAQLLPEYSRNLRI